MMWYAEELKIPYIPAVIMEWEITTADTLKMLVSFVVSYEYAAPRYPTSVMMTHILFSMRAKGCIFDTL